jgi:hypothetical protein
MVEEEILWVPVLRSDHIRALNRVTAKEDRLHPISITRVVNII